MAKVIKMMGRWYVLGMRMMALWFIGGAPSIGWAVLAGQQATCGGGPRHRTFTIPVIERIIELGNGLRTQAWTFNGTVPGPIIEVCEGDRVALVVPNQGTVAHGLDTHAFKIDASKFGPVEPDKTLIIDKVVDTPGVFMDHCAAGPLTDEHIKMGMYGVMIVYPRNHRLQPARELVVTQGAIYGEPDAEGLISATSERMTKNTPFLYVFNGQLTHQPVKVKAGELVRVYFVNVGPGVSAFHVIGAILDRVYEGGNPRNTVYGLQRPMGSPLGAGRSFSSKFRSREPISWSIIISSRDSQRASSSPSSPSRVTGIRW